MLLSTRHWNEVNYIEHRSKLCGNFKLLHIRICHSLCLGGLVDYFSDNEMSVGKGMMYATGLFLSLAISAVSCHPYMKYVSNIAAHIKIGLTGLIYRKVGCINVVTFSRVF